ncbi:MAG: methyltransferase [Synergistaceae bacterium]|nr:50S ribosomal protein L11 methyltransferase [Synergistota bacterium]NLM72305.1 methyltransferase [Synergistaceae bacterium]
MNTALDGFWWYVTLEGRPGSEEVLASLAEMSGSIGSEEMSRDASQLLRAYFRSSQDLGFWLERLGGALEPWPEVRIADMGKIENRQWHTEWKEAFPPLAVGEGLVVLAPWHRGSEPKERLPLYIYPGSAFGTGYHESTQIVLALLERSHIRGADAADIGAGSGILSIAAIKLGARRVLARDHDPAVISEIRHNLELNEIPTGAVALEVGNLLDGLEGKVDLLMANIVIEPLLEMLPSVRGLLKKRGRALFSGLLVKERDRFLKALQEAGLEMVDEISLGDWWGTTVEAN